MNHSVEPDGHGSTPWFLVLLGCEATAPKAVYSTQGATGLRGYSDSATVARAFVRHRNHALYAYKSRFGKGGGRETRKFW